ncbi:MAG: hypothetical protein L0Z62_10845 [Gemmataceae bacterium]|nr:hypothetical protein [Gemmataceae bacterium]
MDAGELRQIGSFRLRDVKDMHDAESGQVLGTLVWKRILMLFLQILLVWLGPAHDGSEDGDALLSFADPASQLPPAVKAGNLGSLWPLQGDEQDVAKAVLMKPGHHVEVGAQLVALASLQLEGKVLKGCFGPLLGFFSVHGIRSCSGAFGICTVALLVGRADRLKVGEHGHVKVEPLPQAEQQRSGP